MRLLAVAAALAMAAGFVVLAGLPSIKASTGHWAVTEWVLDFAKRRSVATRSITIDVPPLEDEALVRVGAVHYDQACRPCHGSPGGPAPVVPARMTPHPPLLAPQVGRWAPRELFYIVGHGIKFTGMPAWPSPQRGDEVWAVVAFLQRLPALDADGYRRLVWGTSGPPPSDTDTVEATLARCLACHGDAPSPELIPVPRLRGQRVAYVEAALEAYASGRRFSGVMTPVAAALAPDLRAALARRLTGREAGDASPLAPAEVVPALARTRGGDPAALPFAGDPARDVPACATCHGPGEAARHPAYPELAGQPAEYLRRQLELFAAQRRGGSPYAAIMQPIAARLTAAQRDAAAQIYAALPGDPP